LDYIGSAPALTAGLLRVWPGSSSAPAQRAPPLSIVVLPFANLGGDPQQDYFVDGITESLTTDLSRALPGSFVAARGTAFTYRGKQIDPRQVGRDLNVRYLLEGSVIAEGDQVRVNAQLIDSDTGTSLWAERFDKKRQNVLEIQDQIVGRLSRAVGLELVDIEARRSERERPSKPSAIDYVMRGQAMANRPTSPQTLIAARALFQRANEDDTDNADALAGLAATYVFEVLNSYYETGRAERLRNGKALLERALARDPRHIVALKVRAALFRAEGEFDDAIAASQAVIAQNPGEPWAYKEVGLSKLYLGSGSLVLGDYQSAAAFLKRTMGLLEGRENERLVMAGYPAVMARGWLSWVLADIGEFEEGVRHGQDALNMAETFGQPFSLARTLNDLGYLYCVRGDVNRSVPVLERALALWSERNLRISSPVTMGFLGYAYALSGRASEGLSLLQEAEAAGESLNLHWFRALQDVHIGETHLVGDRLDEARRYAERALAFARERHMRGCEAMALRCSRRPLCAAPRSRRNERPTTTDKPGRSPESSACGLSSRTASSVSPSSISASASSRKPESTSRPP
jgi:TolB-like protein